MIGHCSVVSPEGKNLRSMARRPNTLEAIIMHVPVHEIGHHFGFSDDDMHGIEDRAN